MKRGRMPSAMGRAEREPVKLNGAVVLRTGRRISVAVTDMSPGGCRVESQDALPVAVTVRLEVEGAVANARVRWALPGAAALQFV